MNSQKVKVHEAVAHLNSLVADMFMIRVKDADHHKKIMDRCAGYLNSLGLDFTTWGARLTWDENSDIHFHDSLLRYTTPNFKKDARFKYGGHGKLIGPPVWVAEYRNGIRDHNNPLIVTPGPGETIRQYVLSIEHAERMAAMAASKAWLLKLQNDVKEQAIKVNGAVARIMEIEQVIHQEKDHEG